ncbi:hypothetical protein [uncultured Rikenella sp.]|nr:hypothetical protein [uncultured Rikenella sp.]
MMRFLILFVCVPIVPAPGYRGPNTAGALNLVGGNGFSWSSATTDKISSPFLRFTTTTLDPCYADHRSFGVPLRCLSE